MFNRNQNKANWEAIQSLVPKNNQFNQQDDPYEFLDMDEGEKYKLLVWCLTLKKNKNINNSFWSYGLKDIYERGLNGQYVTNGEFKGAMLVAGFKVADVSAENWTFNVNTKDIQYEERLCVRQSLLKSEWEKESYRWSRPELLTEHELRKLKLFEERTRRD